MPSIIRSQLLSKPLFKIFSEASKSNPPSQIKCMVNCLHGGKAIGSKCKMFKYYIIAKNVTDPTLLQSTLQAIRKGIVSGKGG